MKVLFDHPWPYALVRGGFQNQIELTKRALENAGAEVEYLRWWDESQTGEIIHYFGRPPGSYLDLAHQKGIKVVMGELHSGLGSRPSWARAVQKAVMRAARTFLPRSFTAKLAWEAYQKADAFIANTAWEAYLIRTMFDADPARIHLIGNGVEAAFFRPHLGGTHLVCTAVIHPRKRILELAGAAVEARVPVWIVGKPYAESDAYYLRFLDLQRRNPDWIRYEGAVADRERLAEIYRTARGFVLLSSEETLSLSALEASAAGCPLLLSDLPWARATFGKEARYVSVGESPARLAAVLGDFARQAPSSPGTFQPPTWDEIGGSFLRLYRQLLKT